MARNRGRRRGASLGSLGRKPSQRVTIARRQFQAKQSTGRMQRPGYVTINGRAYKISRRGTKHPVGPILRS